MDITENISMGKSLAYYEGQKILIDGGYAGQKANICILKMKPARWEASFVEALAHADYETDPLCADFSRCGGCKFQDITYEKQLAFKEHYVRELFRKAKIPYTVFEPILPSPLVWGYRNKMEFSFGDEVKDGELTLGMHEKGRHHNIVSLRECMISPDDFNTVRTACETYFRDLGETHFSTYKKSGFLRHLVLRHSFAKNEILINLVTTGEKSFDADSFADMILALPMQYNIAGILHTISNSQSDAVKPDSVRLLYGEDFLTESLCGLDFRISPFSFFQTNSKGAEVLYSKVREYAGDTADKTIFDLYCGTGTITQVMAHGAKQAVGIEIVPEAIKAAKQNAHINRIENCEFICGDVLEKVDELKGKADIIILDPPRAGIHPKAIDKIIAFAPETFIYVSCKATSLIGELPKFLEAGYEVKSVCPVDMFPHTEHVETCVLLSHKNPQTSPPSL